jgi:signal transduction histidine kinase
VSPATAWQRFSAASVRAFHAYANWLAGISWKRFFLLSVLLLIAASVLSEAVSRGEKETEVHVAPAPARPNPPATPDKHVFHFNGDHGGDGFTISIEKGGVTIKPRSPEPAGAGEAASAAAPGAASRAGVPSAASNAAAPGSVPAEDGAHRDVDVQIKLPPGATSEAVMQAVEEAKAAVVEAIEESRQEEQEAAEEAAHDSQRKVVQTHHAATGNSLPSLAVVFILTSAILKITYKGRIQAEVKAAAATETAESEQLKRQVVEARMAAMQAQVEPHFLFNTLASIDHLIETDPPRASVMQKNLIALLRASMPAMRESHPASHTLGRELAVIRPYLEILKVRMEDRLNIDIEVPDGLLSAEFPPMMIQSLVENAIKHGLEPKPEGGTLSVRAEIIHGNLAVTVADTGLGFGKAATAGTGVGLTNIRERLQLLFANKGSMAIAENSPSGTVVTLTVPYQAQTSGGTFA